MWHFISEQISQHIGEDFICDDIREVSQGDSHNAYKISDGRRRFFIKTNAKHCLPQFEAEADGLLHLAQSGCFKVPKVICTGCVSEHSFLVLEHILLQEGDESQWHLMGQKLAQMHRSSEQAMYGWQMDNFIGRTPQPNQWQKKWSHFFAEQRIGLMLQLLAEKQIVLVNIDTAVESVKHLLSNHQPPASLLHGDLWHGNLGFSKAMPVLFDPAIYFGDRETDIAMTELFSKFPNAFYQGYDSVWPLDPGYQYRKSIYQLYHLLNHALMFGGHYMESSVALLKNMEA